MASKNPLKPNIIFILTDDQGAWAAGCYGNYELITPNIDRLAAEGMMFTNFFCTSPVCSPARASILTGCIPSQHGIHDWIREGNSGSNAKTYLEGIRGYTEYLKDSGYICGISGKWHMGNSQLKQKGFSHWYVHQKGGGDYFSAPMIRDGQEVTEHEYITDLITEDALDFIDTQAVNEKPFYASIHYTAPHSPWINQHPQEFVSLYDDCEFATSPKEPPHPWNLFVKVPDAIPESILNDPKEHLKGYYGSISAMDSNIGKIIDRVESLGLRSNTLICFLSDNGFNCGHHGIWGKGNGTYPQNMYDTSVKIPAIFSHPSRIPEGIISEAMLSQYDIMPTLLSYAGIAYNDPSKPGQDFSDLLSGKTEKAYSPQIVVYDEYGPVRMIRTLEWKYIHRYPNGPHELYHLSDDPEERTNLVNNSIYEKQIHKMLSDMEHWFERYVAEDLDGRLEPVTGKGQLDFVGRRKTSDNSFVEL